MWIISVIIPMPSPKYQDGFLLSNINFRQAAAIKPARIVATVQASLVYSPPPHNGENQRSTPPITPEMIPAGAPKISPAQIGALSRTFMIAPPMSTPNSVANTASIPKITPNTICFLIYFILPNAVFLSIMYKTTLTATGSSPLATSFNIVVIFSSPFNSQKIARNGTNTLIIISQFYCFCQGKLLNSL